MIKQYSIAHGDEGARRMWQEIHLMTQTEDGELVAE